MMKVLIDTNIVIDALTGREPFRNAAEQIFVLAANRNADMYITASSATDIYYLIRKYLHSTQQAKDIMSKLYELFCVLDVTGEDCIGGLSSDVKDYEDAVVSACAQRNQMQYIVTRNIKNYVNSKIPAVLPEGFLKLLSESENM